MSQTQQLLHKYFALLRASTALRLQYEQDCASKVKQAGSELSVKGLLFKTLPDTQAL